MPSFKKILVPTDFSKNASSVYTYTRWLAEKNDSLVDLVHVIPKMSYLEISEEVMGNPFKVQEKYLELREKLSMRLEKELEEEFAEKNRGEVHINDRVRIGRGIVEHSEKHKYDLIVIGSRGKGNSMFKRGSVTLRLIRLANTPVLSFNKPIEDTNFKNILMPTDGSKVSFEALTTAVKLAAQLDCSIELYSVMEFDFDKIKFSGGDTDLYNYVVEGQKKEILENLNEVVNNSSELTFKSPANFDEIEIALNGKTIKLNVTLANHVSAHSSIVNYANDKSDLVVMSTHGRSGISKLLLGSVAEKVVRHLEVPILTIKPDFARKKK